MVTRLVAVPVSSDTALNVVCSGNILRQLHGEQLVEALLEQLLSCQIDVPLHVLGYIPSVLHCESFRDIAPAVHRAGTLIGYGSERCAPLAPAVASAHVFGLGVNQCLVGEGTVQEVAIILFLAQLAGCLCDAIVVVGILQGLRYRFCLLVEGYIAQFAILR